MLPPVDRSYWTNKSSEPIIQLADELLEIINEKAKPTQQLNYNKHYIGLSDGNRSNNFIYFLPRKRYLRVVTPGGWSEELSARFDEAELEAERQKDDELVFNLHPADFKRHNELIRSVINAVVEQKNS